MMSSMNELLQMPQTTERRVLIVDDNSAILRLLATLFEEEGMTVFQAQSAKAARTILEAEGGQFDLVLSDISMPVESGFDLLRWIKRPHSPFAELPVLLMTAQLPEAEYRLKGLALGAVDYVVRPIELRELVLRSINAINHFKRVKHLETMLQDAGQLATVGRLLAASSHEIKNLAAIVNLASDRLTKILGSFQDDPRLKQLLTTLAESSALLTDVARNATSLLDPPTERPRPVEISALVKSIAELMRPRVQPHLILIDVSEYWVLGFSNRIKQILINLILNAAEAINEINSEYGGQITLRITANDTSVGLMVIDNGIGLSEPGERHQFEAFTTTKKLRGGQGLGLWLCSRLLEGMGGELTLSSPGVAQGATATITFQRTTAPQKEEKIDLSPYLIG